MANVAATLAAVSQPGAAANSIVSPLPAKKIISGLIRSQTDTAIAQQQQISLDKGSTDKLLERLGDKTPSKGTDRKAGKSIDSEQSNESDPPTADKSSLDKLSIEKSTATTTERSFNKSPEPASERLDKFEKPKEKIREKSPDKSSEKTSSVAKPPEKSPPEEKQERAPAEREKVIAERTPKLERTPSMNEKKMAYEKAAEKASKFEKSEEKPVPSKTSKVLEKAPAAVLEKAAPNFLEKASPAITEKANTTVLEKASTSEKNSTKPLEKVTTSERTSEKTSENSAGKQPLEKVTTAEKASENSAFNPLERASTEEKPAPNRISKVLERAPSEVMTEPLKDEKVERTNKLDKSDKRQYRMSTGRLVEGGGIAELQKKFLGLNHKEN